MLVELNGVHFSAFLEYLQGGDPSDEVAGLCWYLTAQVLLQRCFGHVGLCMRDGGNS